MKDTGNQSGPHRNNGRGFRRNTPAMHGTIVSAAPSPYGKKEKLQMTGFQLSALRIAVVVFFATLMVVGGGPSTLEARDAGFIACGNWCFKNNKTPKSCGVCIDQCCKYYKQTCSAGPCNLSLSPSQDPKIRDAVPKNVEAPKSNEPPTKPKRPAPLTAPKSD